MYGVAQGRTQLKRLSSGSSRFVQCSDRDVGSGVFVRVLPEGRDQPGSGQAPGGGLRSVCRRRAWAGPSLLQGRHRDGGSGVCAE